MDVGRARHSRLVRLLQIASLNVGARAVPHHITVQLLVTAGISCVMPIVLGTSALVVPIDPCDTRTVPTVYAWAAVRFVPMFASAAFLVRTSFVAGLLPDLNSARFGIVSATVPPPRSSCLPRRSTCCAAHRSHGCS